ncbi:hypothetical protein D7X74_20615 [Corallococcus sp. CA047B]|uniref:MYXO-CTERM sorting domain-containing protein n=1 Tax=Corallococcus sp. CA047B TaxID=2316729 RepID=UPI000EA0A558|nr:MYXO-CTERM sorting domain-containing protein [Corallococcus sp. CA047B]RKH14138.1 hypothetical protein D7X74_20615 [Corallococcus sp. CA047B]
MLNVRVWTVCLGLVLVAGVARAGWTVTQTQNGTPLDVTVFRPGHFAVATDQQLWISRDGGVSTLSEGTVGSYLSGPDCVVGVLTDGTLRSVGGCSPAEGTHLFPTTGDEYELRSVRITPDGGVGYASAALPPLSWEFRSSLVPKQGTAEWGLLSMPLSGAVAQAPLAILPPQSDGMPHALFSVSPTTANFVWYRGTTPQPYPAQGVAPPSAARTVVLLPGVDPAKPLAFYGNAEGLFRGILGSGTSPFEPIQWGGGPASVDALALDVANGSAAGVGFGLMLVKQLDGSVKAFSAEPVPPSSLPGSVWRNNPNFPSGIRTVAKQVSCSGASYCVALLTAPAQNVLIYQNEKTPDLGNVPSSLVIDEGKTEPLILNPRDGDGDAVRVTATTRDPNGLLTSVSGPPPSVEDNGLTLSLTADSGFCASQQAFIDVVASDGLAAHDTAKTVNVRLNHTVRPAAPSSVTVDVPGGVFFAGGAAGTLTPVRGASGCEPVRYLWGTPPARAPRLSVTDTVAMLDPIFTKADRCKTDSTVFNYSVSANDGELTSSTATSVPVEFLPWGPPDAPFPNPPGPLYSGTSLSPQAFHLCAGTPGLPLSTWWSRLDNAPGVSVSAVREPGTAQPAVGGSPVEGPAVVVESQGCADTAVKLRAVHHVTVKGHTLVGPESIVDVTVRPRLVPLDSVKPLLSLDPPEERKVHGRVATPNLNCVSSRNVTTVVTLETPDAAAQVLATRTLTGASGDFELDLPPTCGSAAYNVRVRVQEPVAGGTTATSETVQSLTRDARDVELGDVNGELVAVCAEGARGTLRQTFPPGACTAVNLDWSYVTGPELESPVPAGDSVTLATKDAQLESLVGEFVTLRVAATGEGASGATREHSVQIGARPFVSLGRNSETGPGSDSSQVGVSVSLRNDTACGVSSVRYEEFPSGAEVVLDSVRLNGQPVTPTVLEGGGFAVEPVPLDANTTATLTYVIRPAFLGTPTFSGIAKLRGVVVSQPEAPPPSTSGCGCSGGGSGVTAFGLGALAWLARRRRGVRARS